MKIFNRLAGILSHHQEVKAVLLEIEGALVSGKLTPTDRRQKAMEIVESKGWRSRLDGIDWVELNLYAKEHKMPFDTVADLLSVLKSIGGDEKLPD